MFVKVTQYNYFCPPQVHRTSISKQTTASGIQRSPVMLAKFIEKTFEEKIGTSVVPPIKFSGILFLLVMWLPLVLTAIRTRLPYALSCYTTAENNCARLCVLRI
jgi:hypothetical protein